MKKTLTALSALSLLVACGAQDTTPRLSGVSDTADASVDLIDRQAALQGAADAEQAEAGEELFVAEAGAGFLLEVDGEDLKRMDGANGPPPPVAGSNAVQAVAMVAVAELATFAVVAPPSAAIAIVADGTVTQVSHNVWSATNTVTGPEGASITGDFTVAWVGVGWLAEMRVTSSDGQLQDTKWFSGFVSNDFNLGWWDLYTTSGELAGVVEWIQDVETGNAQFGIAALIGEGAGDLLSWSADGDGAAAVDYWDESAQNLYYVEVAADGSGELLAPEYNGGVPACWDSEDAEDAYANVACPE